MNSIIDNSERVQLYDTMYSWSPSYINVSLLSVMRELMLTLNIYSQIYYTPNPYLYFCFTYMMYENILQYAARDSRTHLSQ